MDDSIIHIILQNKYIIRLLYIIILINGIEVFISILKYFEEKIKIDILPEHSD